MKGEAYRLPRRCHGRQQQVLDLEHYLDVLERKTGCPDRLQAARGLAGTRAGGRQIMIGCSTN